MYGNSSKNNTVSKRSWRLHPQSRDWPRRGVWDSEEGRRPNSGQFSHSLGGAMCHWAWYLEKFSCMFPFRINRPQSKAEKLRMKPNVDGLNMKTTRQPAIRWVRRGKSLSARMTTFCHEKAWPCAILNQDPLTSPRIWRMGGGDGHTHSVNTTVSVTFFPSKYSFCFFTASKRPSTSGAEAPPEDGSCSQTQATSPSTSITSSYEMESIEQVRRILKPVSIQSTQDAIATLTVLISCLNL